jgi:hypothetical protein
MYRGAVSWSSKSHEAGHHGGLSDARRVSSLWSGGAGRLVIDQGAQGAYVVVYGLSKGGTCAHYLSVTPFSMVLFPL